MNLQALIKLHLDLSKASQDASVRKLIVQIFLAQENALIIRRGNETFYNIPYDLITHEIFNNECLIHSNALTSLQDLVEYDIQQCIYSLSSPALSRQKLQKRISHLLECYKKFVQHIHLAYIQKEFILNAAKEANELAQQADESAQSSLSKSQDALDTAEQAKAEAILTSKNITTQFVTILGIFASIIVALFGGMSLVKAAVELLTNNGSLPLFVFVVSILMLSFSGLIVLLTTWISSLYGSQQNNNYVKTKVILFGFLIVCCVGSGLISYDLSKKATAYKEKTSTDIKLELKANQ